MRFPHSQTVRYHLGLLLAWTGQRAQAIKEFTLAVQLGPATPLGREAAEFLSRHRRARAPDDQELIRPARVRECRIPETPIPKRLPVEPATCEAVEAK